MQIYVDKILRSVVYSPTPFTMSFEVPDNLTKSVKVQKGLKHKENDLKQPLYKTQETPFKETIESITVIKYQEKEVINHYTDTDGVTHNDKVIVKEPLEWLDNEPIMVPNMVDEIVTLINNPSQFTLDDIVTVKYRTVLEKSTCNYIIAQEFIEQNINIKDEHHTANIGVGFIQLLPKGQAKTESIILDEEVSTLELLLYEGDPQVELYVNDVKVQNNKVSLSSKTNNIIVTFKNPTDKALLINAYALGY